MKKAFPIALIFLGILFMAAGGYTVIRGFDAKDQVREELLAQNITTPDDASIPSVRVQDAATAESMAQIIDEHALAATDGRTYSEIGRFLTPDGGDTNDEALAAVGADGRPLSNPIRNVAFQASALRTSLYTTVMAFNVSDLVVGVGFIIVVLGVAVGGIGVALAGLAIPALARRFQVEPVAAGPAR